MMNRIRQYLIEWNTFSSEDEINGDCEQISPTNSNVSLVRQQRIATRVYGICFAIALFFLVICTLLSWHTKVVTIAYPSLETYQALQKKYSIFLNCPCSTNTMSYENFIVTETTMHQICSSDFIRREWIDAFYLPNASLYTAVDFRTTANSQFELLHTLCSLARENILHALFDLNNTQLPTANVVSEQGIFIQTKITSDRIRSVTLVDLNNALKLIELSTYSNQMVSALNTNLIFIVDFTIFSSVFAYWSSHTTWDRIVKNQTVSCNCQHGTCSLPAGFYSFGDMDNFNIHWVMNPQKHQVSYMIPGFVGSCTPLEAVLQATFICLYDRTCIKKLADYFPRLTPLMPTIRILNSSIASKYSRNVNVNRLVQELFLEKWIISLNYSRYYTSCAPKSCTYSYTKRADFTRMIVTMISLYGGLQTILKFFIPLIVKYIMKQQSVTNNTTAISTRKRIKQRLVIYFGILKRKFFQWNLFKSSDRSSETIRHQQLSTRIYLCLLIGSLFILLLFTTISEQTTSVTHHRPSYTIYKQLYRQYSDKLTCTCSEITPAYGSFLTITPTYHPVCSSAFVKPIWFEQLKLMIGGFFTMSDWRIMSIGYFRLVEALCKLAHEIVSNDLQAFHTRTIVTTRLLHENLLHSEINDTLDQLIHSMQIEFKRVNNILRLFFKVNQYFSGTTYNGQLELIPQSAGKEHVQIKIRFDRPSGLFYQSQCVCAFHSDCEEPMLIFHISKRIVVPGFVWRCSAMDSLLYSTLECLYSNTNCLKNILLNYINYTGVAVPVPPLKVSQLIRTSSNSTVGTLVDNLFVEEWKTSFSFQKYFKICAPRTCQYTYVKRANHLYVITMFLAVYGGLTLVLHLLVKLASKLILRCHRSSASTDKSDHKQISTNTRLTAFYHWVSTTIKATIVHCNLFRTYSFGKHIDQPTRTRLGRLTTRLYICLYITGIIILVLYTAIEQRTITITIDHPSLASAQQLHRKYIDTIECPCTRASIPLEQFVSIQARFHQICTSTFVKTEWHDNLTANLYKNMSYFASINDYRLFLSAHLQFLSGLCEQAMKHVNETVRSFTSTSLITSRLLSQTSFDQQLTNLLHQTETNVPTILTRSLHLVRSVNLGNALMSVYGSNYRFLARENSYKTTVLYTLPIIYQGLTNCSCESQSKCVQPGAFTWPRYVPIKGLLIGCLPSESFFASTLECFFDVDCIDLIRNHMHGDMNRTHAYPLNVNDTSPSRYQINTTINDLVAKLFMEEWLPNISYARYYNECAPNVCSYSYIDNANPLYVTSTVLGLYSGLTIVLSWWCPRIIIVVRQIKICYKRKRQICASTISS